MQLYTERHGIRAPKESIYHINIDMYYLLFNCCKKYKNNLIHLFTAHNHDDFTDTDYVIFDNKSFITKIRVLIPSLSKMNMVIYVLQRLLISMINMLF